MARAPSEERQKARLLWLQSNKTATNTEIAKRLGVSTKSIQRWRKDDCWEVDTISEKRDKKDMDIMSSPKKKKSSKFPRGAPPGNKNAVGHGAPKGNINNVKTGRYSKRYWDCITDEEMEIAEEIFDSDRLEERMLEDQLILFSIRERRLMQMIKMIKDKKDKNGDDMGLLPEASMSELLYMDPETGEVYTKPQLSKVTSRAVPKDKRILPIEAELTKLQEKKTKCIVALDNIRSKREERKDNGSDEEKIIFYLPENGR